MGLGPGDPLDPWLLAENHGIPVVSLTKLAVEEPNVDTAVKHFSGGASGSMSAMLLPRGLGAVIIENDAHANTRRRANLTHELGHVFLEHPFGFTLFDGSCRNMNQTVEDEAAWLGGVLLIPRHGALECARDDMTDSEVAGHYRTSEQMAKWRMDASGVRRQVKRERSKRRR